MICRCFGKTLDVGAWAKSARETAELVVGLPSYETYRAHVAARHPGQDIPTRDEFFRARQAARFGGGGGLRCC